MVDRSAPSSSPSAAGPVALAAALAAALLLGVACTFSSEISVSRHELLNPPPPGLVNSYNVEEQLQRGYIPETLEFLVTSGGKSLDSTRFLRVLGQALLERGDARGAIPVLERAHAEEGRQSLRAELAWMEAQAHWYLGDCGEAARWARTARAEGTKLPEGWITFLESGRGKTLYAGTPAGEKLALPLLYGRPEIPRVTVRINDRAADSFVFDTGASISLVTEASAERFGIVPVEGAVAGAYGLHRVEFPMRFGWADTLRLGGVTLRDVPFGIVPDEALTFTTLRTGEFRFDGVLGIHLLREFDWRLEYGARRLAGIRLDPALPRGSKGQNLFFRRLKPMVRVSVEQRSWFLFLFDTGSEPTMLTRAGVRRSKPAGGEATSPMTLEGIGKSRVSWQKISDVTVGVDRWMVQFRDMVVKEDSDGLEEGVLGSSFLGQFNAEIRFSTMKVTLENPLERRVEPETGAAPQVSPRPPGYP